MKRFFYKISLLGILSLIIYFLLAVMAENLFREPVLTTSVSFDKKMQFLKKRNFEKVDIISVGSSMTLNNLNSSALDSGYNLNGKYLNLGAWGLQMTDIYALTVYFVEKYSPRLVLLSGSLTDFEKEGSYFALPDNEMLDCYFSGQNLRFFLKHVDLNTYLERNLELKNSETGNFDYKCLKYDDYGGVFLEVRGENIDQIRWNRPVQNPKSVQFDALQNLSHYLKNKGIKFVFIQCPVKLRAETAETDKIIINNYIVKVKQIIENHNNLFLDFYSEMEFSEQDFCDTYHLNSEASEKFTRKVFDFLKQSDYLK